MGYQPNSTNVVHDTIDGEVLAIRSDTGAYYSMTGSAATAWCGVISGLPVEDVAKQIAAHHGVSVDDIAATLTEFGDRLVAESLLVASDDTNSLDDLSLPSETAGTPWDEPAFEKYTDMEDLGQAHRFSLELGF